MDSLFGTRNYDLSFPSGHPSAALLFGENGSGKTTLLRATYSILHPEILSNKRVLFRAPFLFIGIELANGARFCVRKDEPFNDQVILFSFATSTGAIFSLRLVARDGKTTVDAPHDYYIAAVTAFREDRQDLYFLSHTRKLETTTRLLRDPITERVRLRRLGYEIDPTVEKFDADSEILFAIGRLHSQMQTQARRASNAGNAQANEIYTRIIRDLARSSRAEMAGLDEIPALRARITDQSRLRNAYANSGLTEPQQDDRLLDILSNVASANADAVADVTSAYVRTEDARLRALGRVHSQITEFVDALRTFLTHKVPAFDLATGLQLSDDGGRRLDPRVLSSGEKQLLLLLATVYSIDDQPSIFLIDEPELSLNVDWQRLLMRNLLLSVHDKPVQLVIATHSLDILSQNTDQTIELQPIVRSEEFQSSVATFINEEPMLDLS